MCLKLLPNHKIRKENMRDPKFGYHWIWMLPVAVIIDTYYAVKSTSHRYHIKWILKKNPDIAELSKLSGINK